MSSSKLVLLLLAASLAAAPAHAVQQIGGQGGIVANATQLGAFAVAPYLTHSPPAVAGGDLMTAVLVTNALSRPVFVNLIFVDGEVTGLWGAPSLPDCILSPRETTVFRFTPEGSDTRVRGECSNREFDPAQTAFPQLNGLNTPFSTVLDRSRKGFVAFVATGATGTGTPGDPVVKNPDLGNVNALVVDWTVVDYAAGEAYSAEAHHFQVGQSTTPRTDGKFAFGGPLGKLTGIPLVEATNIIAPDCENRNDPSTCNVDVEFILVPLDGRINEPPHQVVNFDVFNDDEVVVDRKREYDCFQILRLASVDSRFLADDLCNAPSAAGCVGHVEMTNLVTTAGILHDTLNGDGNLLRNSATIAWVIHRFRPDNGLATRPDGEILNYLGAGGAGVANRAATARIFISGMDAVTPLLADPAVVFDASVVLP